MVLSLHCKRQIWNGAAVHYCCTMIMWDAPYSGTVSQHMSFCANGSMGKRLVFSSPNPPGTAPLVASLLEESRKNIDAPQGAMSLLLGNNGKPIDLNSTPSASGTILNIDLPSEKKILPICQICFKMGNQVSFSSFPAFLTLYQYTLIFCSECGLGSHVQCIAAHPLPNILSYKWNCKKCKRCAFCFSKS